MKKYLACASIVLSVLLARIVPFNFIVGSCGAWFSWSTMMAPVLCKHAGLWWISLFLIPVKSLSFKSLFVFLLHRLPLFAASAAYRSKSVFFSIFLPLTCMVLFTMHPVGLSAWPYAAYWVIPIILYFLPSNLFVQALSASFVAHTVGSVVWLYSGNIPSPVWLGLIPVVAVERLLMAAGIVGIEVALVTFKKLASRCTKRFSFASAV